MFDRIVMDVIQMFVEVVFVADAMIIKARLPNGFRFVFSGFRGNMS
jgi:hypothetical protein